MDSLLLETTPGTGLLELIFPLQFNYLGILPGSVPRGRRRHELHDGSINAIAGAIRISLSGDGNKQKFMWVGTLMKRSCLVLLFPSLLIAEKSTPQGAINILVALKLPVLLRKFWYVSL